MVGIIYSSLSYIGISFPSVLWVRRFYGGDIDAIRELIRASVIRNDQIRFFLGYSGWSAGQLERELKENSWVIAKVKSDTVMNSRGDEGWKRVLRSFKNKYRMWADFPESPEMN